MHHADVLGRGRNVCKSPQSGAPDPCLRNSREASVAVEELVTGGVSCEIREVGQGLEQEGPFQDVERTLIFSP